MFMRYTVPYYTTIPTPCENLLWLWACRGKMESIPYEVYYWGACGDFYGRALAPLLILEESGTNYTIKDQGHKPEGIFALLTRTVNGTGHTGVRVIARHKNAVAHRREPDARYLSRPRPRARPRPGRRRRRREGAPDLLRRRGLHHRGPEQCGITPSRRRRVDGVDHPIITQATKPDLRLRAARSVASRRRRADHPSVARGGGACGVSLTGA